MASKHWDFHVTASEISRGKWRVTLASASGRVVVREGWHPLWELVRGLSSQRSNVEHPEQPREEAPHGK